MNFETCLMRLSQPVVILDNLGQVTAMNPAFEGLFPKVQLTENMLVFTKDYPVLLPLLTCGEGQYTLEQNRRHFNVNISFARYGKKKRPIARCILMTDETETMELLRESERQGEELRRSNEQVQLQNARLQKAIRVEREASALREQTRLLRDIHDTLGHTLVMVGALYNLALDALPDQKKSRKQLREVIKWIGVSIAELESARDYSQSRFTDFLHRFSASMARVGLTIVPVISGEETDEHGYMYADLMRICQEAATNAIKHGNATRLEVRYRAGVEDISLRIKDNGRSQQVMGNGFGLAGMDERVNNLFGDLAYGWEKDGGFFVHVDAPVIRDDEEEKVWLLNK